MKTGKKIAVFGVKTVPYTGGIENVVENTMPHITNFSVVVYVRKKYFSNESLKNVKIVSLPHLKGKTLEAVSHTLVSIMHALFVEKASIYFFHAVVLGIFTPIPKLFGKKVILQTHGLDWKREKWGKLTKLLIRLSTYCAVKIPHKTMCVGNADKDYLRERYNKDLTIIGNGVSIPEYVRDDNLLEKYKLLPKSYILFMSRLVPEKGAHLLISAFKSMLENPGNSNFKLVIAGDTNYYDDYYYSLRNNETENIVFTGFVKGDQKYTLLKNALVFVQPSTIEGMSTGILEAMAMGITPVVSDIKENLDVVKNFGYSFRSESSDDLAKVLSEAIENSDNKSAEMSEYTIMNYSWNETISKLNRIFKEL